MNTEENRRRVRLAMLVNEWFNHQGIHAACNVTTEDDCPARVDLNSWLELHGFSGKDYEDQISGRKSTEPNFRSESDSNENPVADSGGSIADKRRAGTLRPAFTNYEVGAGGVEDEGVPQDAPESHEKAPQSAGSNDWVPEAMEYYKERLDALETTLDGIVGMVSDVQEQLVRVEDALKRKTGTHPNSTNPYWPYWLNWQPGR